MREKKWTKGPWHIKKHLDGGGSTAPYEVTRIALEFNTSGFSQTITELPIGGENNAHLMAAAPELVETLERLTELSVNLASRYFDDPSRINDYPAIIAAKAALSKAYGEQHE